VAYGDWRQRASTCGALQPLLLPAQLLPSSSPPNTHTQLPAGRWKCHLLACTEPSLSFFLFKFPVQKRRTGQCVCQCHLSWHRGLNIYTVTIVYIYANPSLSTLLEPNACKCKWISTCVVYNYGHVSMPLYLYGCPVDYLPNSQLVGGRWYDVPVAVFVWSNPMLIGTVQVNEINKSWHKIYC
jgi:hypothetical protein